MIANLSEPANQLNSNADGTFKVIIKNEGQAAGGKTNTLEVRKPSSPLTGMWQECESVCCSSKSKIHKRQRARRDRETSAGAVIKCIPDKAQSSDLLLSEKSEQLNTLQHLILSSFDKPIMRLKG